MRPTAKYLMQHKFVTQAAQGPPPALLSLIQVSQEVIMDNAVARQAGTLGAAPSRWGCPALTVIGSGTLNGNLRRPVCIVGNIRCVFLANMQDIPARCWLPTGAQAESACSFQHPCPSLPFLMHHAKLYAGHCLILHW